MDRRILVMVSLLACWACSSTAVQVRSDLVAMSQVLVDTAEEVRCYNFSIGQPHRQEFYSPGYPNKYPAKLDCIIILKGDYGQVIRVDFRDQFDVEPHHQCLYDFLEVRDGAHGYSPLIARFCGRSFPPVITSTERFLWLRFSTDDNIEYTGFRAIYQFLPDPRPARPDIGVCRFEVSGLDGEFGRRDISDEIVNYSRDFKVPLDCTWVITVNESQKIQLSFPAYALASPNECDLNFIEIFGEKTDMQNRLRHFCGSAIEVVLSKTNVLHLRLFTHYTSVRSTFDAIFTAVTLYRETEGIPKCNSSEFDCEDAVCIDSSLRCNGRLNCKFRYDEENCKIITTKAMSSNHIIVILTILCLTIFGLCFGCIYKCVRKLKADHRVYQTRRSRSRENNLDATDGKAASTHNPSQKSLTTLAQFKSRAAGGSASNADGDLDDVFQRSRLQTSTSRSLSASIMHNGFVDSCVNIERYDLPSLAKSGGDRRMHPPVAESSDRASDDEDADEEEDDDEEEEVEMVDHACQTRESLFDSNSEPAAPPAATAVRSLAHQARGLAVLPVIPPPADRGYRTERAIELSRSRNNPPVLARAATTTNSSSAASSKSGADVVFLH